MRRCGLALLVTVGVLGILAALAATFATLTRLERRASQRRLWEAQASLLARSGIEDALARLSAGQVPDYGGEDWDDSGALDGPEPVAEVYRQGRLDGEGCPVRHAMRPSFFVEASSGPAAPALESVEGRSRGYSGRLPGGRLYALRVLEPGLHVNGGDLSSAGEHPGTYDGTLKRILGNLAEALGVELLRADGEALVTSRPPGGWISLDQIRDLALGGSQAKREALEPYLALHAWVDRKVIRPTALPALRGVSPKAWAELKRGESDSPYPDPWAFSGGRSSAAPAFEPRAPVSLAWALRHKAVLVALMRDLEGLYLEGLYADAYGMGDPYDPAARQERLGQVLLAQITAGDAELIADHLMAWTSDLSTWEGVNTCLEAVTDLSTQVVADTAWIWDPAQAAALLASEAQAKRDLLKANFNPNSDLNKFNPSPAMRKLIDKGDLLAYSTEWSLVPVHGHVLSCAGRILDAKGRLLAGREVSVEVPAGVVRLTSQREFVCEDLGRLELAGDETGVRLPGSAPFLTKSQGTVKTWGHRQPGLDPGLGLQTYPEPSVSAPADYDGSLQLATVETMTGPGQRLLARYDVTADLSEAASGSLSDQPDLKQAPPGNSLLDPSLPHTLHPDGVYAERFRAPAYETLGKVPPFHGLVSFWVKPNYGQVPGLFPVRGRLYLNLTNFGPAWLSGADPFDAGNANQAFLVCQPAGASSPCFAGFFETGHATQDFNPDDPLSPTKELGFRTPEGQGVVPGRWRLLTFSWCFQDPDPDPDLCGDLVIDDGTGTSDLGLLNDYSVPSPNDWTQVSDLTVDHLDPGGSGTVQPHRMVLGHRAMAMTYKMGMYLGSAADATFDELAVYDFGPGEGPALLVATDRYKDGRHYKGAAYATLAAAATDDQAGGWFSPPLALPAGSVLRRLHWAWYRPGGLEGDYAELALTDAAGTAYLGAEAASRSVLAGGWTKDAASWPLRLAPPGLFRIQAVFRRTQALDPDEPLLDSPVLDDVTVLYDPPGGPRLLAWDAAAR